MNDTTKVIILGVVTLSVLIGGVFMVVKNTQPPKLVDINLDEIAEGEWIKGSTEAPIQVIEYSDFECPFCSGAVENLNAALEEYGDDVAVTFRNFPLNMHRNADLMARAAEAAGLQGKFWEMHDMIFENQKEWSKSSSPKSSLLIYAESIGLDKVKFEKDLESPFVKSAVKQDKDSATSAGVNSTPTFFVNGKLYKNPGSKQGFIKIFEETAAGIVE